MGSPFYKGSADIFRFLIFRRENIFQFFFFFCGGGVKKWEGVGGRMGFVVVEKNEGGGVKYNIF